MKKKLVFPHIRQGTVMECGTTCLAIILKYYGFFDVRNFLSSEAQVAGDGIDLFTISELAEGFGFSTDGFQMGFEHLQDLTLPAIAHYEGNHFVVIYKASKDKVWISDPATGKYVLTKEEFNTKWNGVVLVLEPGPELFKHNELTELAEQRREQRQSLWKAFYLSSLESSKPGLIRVAVITVILIGLGLILPFFTRLILDEVLVNENQKLLYAILIALIFVFASKVLLSFGRNVFMVDVKVHFERTFFSKFFDHLIHLNQDYFDRHKREDFINRFGENIKIRNALNPGVLSGFIDFVFLPLYVAVLFYLNVTLSAFVMLFIALYLGIVVLVAPRLKSLENVVFHARSKTLGKFLDAMLGIQTVRLLGIERLQFWRWKNMFTRGLNKVIKAEKVYIQLSTMLGAFIYAIQAGVYWVGAYLTFNGTFTIGSYVAYITIFTIVINTAQNMKSMWFFFTELSVTFDRINDIFVEERIEKTDRSKNIVKGPVRLALQNVSFKYRERDDHYVLKGVNLTIEPGEFVGIVGRNGSGKSTLVKLLANFYGSYEGNIMLNDTEMRHVANRSFQRIFAFIPQQVYLFDASLKQNIMYGNPKATDVEIFEAAEMAGLADFVQGQYTGFNMMIGETGMNLSGGERLK
ncbi:MAG: peptidase domain-containing ABC transporter, partial [Bacteroidota bacterium]